MRQVGISSGYGVQSTVNRRIVTAFVCGLACSPTGSSVGDAGTDGSGTEAGTGSNGGVGSASSTDSETGGSASATATTGGSSATVSGTSGASTETGAGSTGGLCPDTISCGNRTFSCGNGLDDDGDGLVDTDDPECVSPCDDDESTFPTGIPGGNPGCHRDCYFDGNTGVGDDECVHQLRCDPLAPAADLGCPVATDPDLCLDDPDVGATCLDACTPLVPNGCDCWGCCQLPGSVDWVYLDFSDCSVSNPSACPPCTPNMGACGNPCEHDACEICIGETEPPVGCAEPACSDGQACSSYCDCPASQYCVTGCCRDAPG